ncbi:MAG TPA: hypothetical protein PLP19_12230 [bacterium]|nr:hypothetical protein [bacterium]HPN44251.1 hypothetical protein [bacterium]
MGLLDDRNVFVIPTSVVTSGFTAPGSILYTISLGTGRDLSLQKITIASYSPD